MDEPVGVAGTPVASKAGIAVVRVGVALMWIQNSGWKYPPHFGEKNNGALYRFTRFAIDYEVFPPWAWFVEHVVLENFVFFGWATLLVEASLGAFLLIGLLTRFWALVGMGQSLVITFSVLYAPHEWHWAYFLMLLAHLALLATAAGRAYGIDELWRPVWLRSPNRAVRLLGRLS
ncbi:TQO small subunit DoxD [Actinomadura sp. 3N407]|uniref:TQO small subunit DoxD n=1 Tax=Actinomadura sp. 3N407 TaxID=3457423 RepID=UPI003FCDF3BB